MPTAQWRRCCGKTNCTDQWLLCLSRYTFCQVKACKGKGEPARNLFVYRDKNNLGQLVVSVLSSVLREPRTLTARNVSLNSSTSTFSWYLPLITWRALDSVSYLSLSIHFSSFWGLEKENRLLLQWIEVTKLIFICFQAKPNLWSINESLDETRTASHSRRLIKRVWSMVRFWVK